MIRPLLLMLLLCLALTSVVGCAGNGGESPDSAETITGTVMDVSPSAQIILLTAPQNGFDTIALTEQTTIMLEDGTITDYVEAAADAGAPTWVLAVGLVLHRAQVLTSAGYLALAGAARQQAVLLKHDVDKGLLLAVWQ